MQAGHTMAQADVDKKKDEEERKKKAAEQRAAAADRKEVEKGNGADK